MNKEQKGGGEIIKAGSVKLDFWQKFNVVAGMVCLAVMPVALVLMVNPGFRFSFSIQLVAYIVVLIAYCAWFFTAHRVFVGTAAGNGIVDRTRKKYLVIDYISRVCTAVCPLFVFLAFFLMGTEAGRGQTGYFLHLSEWVLAIASVAAFSVCRYLEICFAVYDIKKSHICLQDFRTRQ